MNTVTTICTALVLCLGIAATLWLIARVAVYALEQGLRALEAYRDFCEYIWHRKQFKEWVKGNCKIHTPHKEKI